MSNLQVFTFNTINVRAVADDNGEFWFVANDVCTILGYKNTSLTVTKHCKTKGISKRYTPTESGNQEMVYINEPNLYRLIIKSRKPEAGVFEEWVMEEVLPSIRKTGSYRLTLDARQQYEVKEAVSRNVAHTGRTYQAVYHDLYSRFSVPKYQDILSKDFQAALAFLNGHLVPREKPSVQPDIDEDGRWLVVVENRRVKSVKNLKDWSVVDAVTFDKLMMQAKQQSEYLLELARRFRFVRGDCSSTCIDTPIEESHPHFII